MLRRICLRALDFRADPRLAIVTVVFVAVFRFVAEFNLRNKPSLRPELLFHAMGDSLVFYTTSYFIFSGILTLLIPGRPSGIGAVVCLGLLLGIVPPVVEIFVPSLGGRYYDYMFDWQIFFYDHDFQPLTETITIWTVITATALFVAIVSRSAFRAIVGFVLAWLGLGWLGVIVPSLLFHGASRDLLTERWQMSAVFLVTSAVLFHALRFRAHWPSFRRMNHALPFGGLAFCGAAFARFEAPQTAWRVAFVLYLCLVLLVHNDFYDREEDRLAKRDSSTDSSDVMGATSLATLALLTISRAYPMVAMSASGLLLLGFAYHHPAFRLKENFCLSYVIEGGWALSAFCTGVSGAALFAAEMSVAWPCLLVFCGGALLSIPKDWKDLASDRLARIPTLYVRFSSTAPEELELHQRVVIAVGLGMLLALLLVWLSYGFSSWLIALSIGSVPVLAAARGSFRSRAVERYLTLLGCWLFGAGLLLRDVLG
jgi:hypothetical protein